MADTVDRPPHQTHGLLPQLVSSAIDEHLVADAPDDYDEVMEKVPVAPGWVRVLALVAALALPGALIIFVVIGLCGGVS
jgi:hypothetical protein